MVDQLTEKQKRFADAYLETLNATKSAKIAGYSEKTAGSIGRENLRKPQIMNYINAELETERDQRIMSRNEALELLSDLARGHTKETITLFVGEGVQDTIEIPTPSNVRKQALELLLKRYDIASKDKLTIRKLELEIEKMEKEMTSEVSTEDKLAQIIDRFDDMAVQPVEGSDEQ